MRHELPLKASRIRVENSPVPVEGKFVTSEKDVIQFSKQCYKANTNIISIQYLKNPLPKRFLMHVSDVPRLKLQHLNKILVKCEKERKKFSQTGKLRCNHVKQNSACFIAFDSHCQPYLNAY